MIYNASLALLAIGTKTALAPFTPIMSKGALRTPQPNATYSLRQRLNFWKTVLRLSHKSFSLFLSFKVEVLRLIRLSLCQTRGQALSRVVTHRKSFVTPELITCRWHYISKFFFPLAYPHTVLLSPLLRCSSRQIAQSFYPQLPPAVVCAGEKGEIIS
jgi:hypothetical protein